jgi:hypothetical protein
MTAERNSLLMKLEMLEKFATEGTTNFEVRVEGCSVVCALRTVFSVCTAAVVDWRIGLQGRSRGYVLCATTVVE